MTKRFKLTTGFLVVSVVIFVTAALLITRSATTSAEANVVEVISTQSGKDAQVIAGMVTGLMPSTDGSTKTLAAPTDSTHTAASMAVATFLRTSDIVCLSLFTPDGTLIWSSDINASALSPTDGAFSKSLAGDMSSALNRDVPFTDFDGRQSRGDIVATFIPLLDPATGLPSQVLEVGKDVTDDLHTRIDSARTSMFQTVFGTLGGAFIVLFGVVLSADMILWRSGQRALTNERALSEEKILATRLELENQQLRQMNEERDRFLSMVSHELRTPLTSILGFTDVLARRQEGATKERNVKHLEVMRRNGEHLNSLIGELLDIGHIQSGRFEVEKERFEAAGFIEEVEQSANALFNSRRQTLRVDMLAKDAEIYGDRRRVMQVLMNLLSNASKYSPAGSRVTLTVERQGTGMRFSVADQGNGIPEQDRKRLFERFYRRDDEVTRSQSGLGLGLSIVKAIVEAHDGKVGVESVVGRGTVMSVTLPGSQAQPGLPAFIPVQRSEGAPKQEQPRTAGERRALKPAEAVS